MIGVPAYLIDGAQDIRLDWFDGVNVVLVTAGASAPEIVVESVLDFLRDNFDAKIEVRSLREEAVSFPLPRELRSIAAPREAASGLTR